jgi:asparagine synthase (glutamine-hydrolysing)
VRKQLLGILSDDSSPLLPLIDKEELINLTNGKSDYGKPWFEQLMAKPQLFAYLIQVNIWMRKYRVRIV